MLSRKPWGVSETAVLCAAVFATMLGSGLIAMANWGAGANAEFVQMMISLVFLQVAIFVWITFFLRFNHTGWIEAFGLGLSEPATAVAYGVLTGALFLPAGLVLQKVSEVIMQLVHLTPEAQAAVKELQNPNLSLQDKLIFGVAAIFVAPIWEEAFFRGILYPLIKQLGFPRLALWGTSAVFAIMHANEETLLPLLVFALALVYLYETFENLLAPIAAHSLFNTANFLILLFQDKIEHFLRVT